MSKLDFPRFEKHLSAFDFARLFIDVLGWNRPGAERDWLADQAGETGFSRRAVAELGGVIAIQVVVDGGWPDESQRLRDHRPYYDDDSAALIAELCAEDIARFGYRFDL